MPDARRVVDVRWSTDAPARDAYLFVYATRTRDPDKDRTPRVATATQGRLRRRSFHVRMPDAAAKRYVHVAVAQLLGHPRRRIVRVRIQ